MSLERNFCSSPWIHTRITATGDFDYCRWNRDHADNPKANIRQVHPIAWFQQQLAPLRRTLLDGDRPRGCEPCAQMEAHGKVSGRQKQLLKTGVQLDQFSKTMLSSPWLARWTADLDSEGTTDVHVQDWQIDLGNYCNSACLFCSPRFSSRIASERLKLGMIKQLPPPSWCDDQSLLDRFIADLSAAPHIRYLHFIGGETIITPSFRKILQSLVDADLHRELTVGFTTNLTTIDHSLEHLLGKFYHVNLGLSIECMDRVNDYVRYGGEIGRTLSIMDQWLQLANDRQWLVQIRTTPTALSISRLHAVYEYAWQHKVIVESCNFITDPVYMRPSVLPRRYRDQARDSLVAWISSKMHRASGETIINIRDPNHVYDQLLQDAQSYVTYLETEEDLDHLLPDLVAYLKCMDQSRRNSVFDYLPEYEELFRSAGY